MTTHENAPPRDGWRLDPHADLEAYVWLDTLTLDERAARIDHVLAGLACIADPDLPAGVELGGWGE